MYNEKLGMNNCVAPNTKSSEILIENLYDLSRSVEDLKNIIQEKFDSLYIPTSDINSDCCVKDSPTRSRFFDTTFNEVELIREKISYIKNFVNDLEF